MEKESATAATTMAAAKATPSIIVSSIASVEPSFFDTVGPRFLMIATILYTLLQLYATLRDKFFGGALLSRLPGLRWARHPRTMK